MRKNRHQSQRKSKNDADTRDLESTSGGNRRGGTSAGNRSPRDSTRSANRSGGRKGMVSPGRRTGSHSDPDIDSTP